ncbi:hypothetical protein SYJ56_25030 [Algoriphagus sp. D3-2-R+10]|nr:hypothetical protein [Algoriphagus sp. D3-2-R+10]
MMVKLIFDIGSAASYFIRGSGIFSGPSNGTGRLALPVYLPKAAPAQQEGGTMDLLFPLKPKNPI